jgi:Flp pilus assembly protein TadG
MRFVRQRRYERARGQSLAEFAIAFPVFMLIVGGIIQFGVIFWGQNTLNQVVRDTGRWAATQQANPCNSLTTLAATADKIALNSSFIGYAAGQWTASGHYVAYPDNTALPAAAPTLTGLEVVWSQREPDPLVTPVPCPPADNTTVWFVTIRATSQVPIFFPFVPGGGNLSSTTDFRMEPAP